MATDGPDRDSSDGVWSGPAVNSSACYWVGWTIRAVASISTCLSRRIGRAKHLETLDYGALGGSGPICGCALTNKARKRWLS